MHCPIKPFSAEGIDALLSTTFNCYFEAGKNIKMSEYIKWYKVLDNPGDLPEGRVQSVEASNKTFCLTHYKGQFACLDNKCPHQGGPLAEGSIENGALRCPWHGWDFDPISGKAPGGHDDGVDTFPVEIREDGI